MPESRAEFIHRTNVANYRRQLAMAADEGMRIRLVALIAAEQAMAVAAGWPPTLG